jgi:hypothetical protein
MSEFWMKDGLGGPDAFRAVGPITRRVKERLEKLDAKTYSPILREFGIALWADGSVEQSKETSGVSSVRVSAKSHSASFTIVMKEAVWKRGPQVTKKFLRDTIFDGFEAIVTKAETEKISIDGESLLNDVERVLRTL